ncbi:hypothetical protein F5X68DRAFT_235016 [Plectosphaerella plurivora]|uniref:Uncharacterized protein n=1 Tax=Plectosphaerella plurivora TaxID=936078 RepID=A0A9P9A9F7_9PEZI|nr:hypothetical protein F5X68DRAFT_235016 [Plectosphaerella plurivora]
MKLLSSLTALALAGAAVADFVAFPDNLSCLSTTGTRIITLAELESAVLNNKRSLIEKNASNMAVGAACQRLTDSLYAVDFPEVGSIYFVFKPSTGTYTFCSGAGVPEDGIGYPSVCQAV